MAWYVGKRVRGSAALPSAEACASFCFLYRDCNFYYFNGVVCYFGDFNYKTNVQNWPGNVNFYILNNNSKLLLYVDLYILASSATFVRRFIAHGLEPET